MSSSASSRHFHIYPCLFSHEVFCNKLLTQVVTRLVRLPLYRPEFSGSYGRKVVLLSDVRSEPNLLIGNNKIFNDVAEEKILKCTFTIIF